MTTPMLPRETLADLGHGETEVFETRTGYWAAACSCGWVSTKSALQRAATQSAVHHLRSVRQLVAQNALSAGVSFSEMLSMMASDQPQRHDAGSRPLDGHLLPHERSRAAGS